MGSAYSLCTSRCKTWQLRNHADAVVHACHYVCRNGVIHDAYARSKADVSAYGPKCPVGFDGHCSQMLGAPDAGSGLYSGQSQVKRLPRAMSVESDEWVEFLDVRGCDA
jgi:hypothetical protein